MNRPETTHSRRRIAVELREDVASAVLVVLRHQDGDGQPERLVAGPAVVALERALRTSETGGRRGTPVAEAG